MRYPKELKQKVLARMMAPGNETVSVLAREFNVTEATLYAWRRSALQAGVAAPGDGRAAEQWTGAAKFAVVLETASLSEAELGEYCRARGLFPEQVRAWRELCEAAFDPAAAGSKAASQSSRQARTCSGNKPRARQYSPNSASDRDAVSRTTANFAAPVHCSAARPSPGAATPACSALRRHAYNVASVTLNSLARTDTVSFPGAIIRANTFCFSSFGYLTSSSCLPPACKPEL